MAEYTEWVPIGPSCEPWQVTVLAKLSVLPHSELSALVSKNRGQKKARNACKQKIKELPSESEFQRNYRKFLIKLSSERYVGPAQNYLFIWSADTLLCLVFHRTLLSVSSLFRLTFCHSLRDLARLCFQLTLCALLLLSLNLRQTLEESTQV